MHFDVYICRRLASSKVNNAENPHNESSPNMHEMSADMHYAQTSVQSEAGAPRDNRSSINDVTLIDNDLYQ